MNEIKLKGCITYTIAELVKTLHISRQTLLSYIYDGRLQAVRVGARYQVTEKALKDFLEGKTTQNKPTFYETKLRKGKAILSDRKLLKQVLISGWQCNVCEIEGGVSFELANKDKTNETGLVVHMQTKHAKKWYESLSAISSKIAVSGDYIEGGQIAANEVYIISQTWQASSDEPPKNFAAIEKRKKKLTA